MNNHYKLIQWIQWWCSYFNKRPVIYLAH